MAARRGAVYALSVERDGQSAETAPYDALRRAREGLPIFRSIDTRSSNAMLSSMVMASQSRHQLVAAGLGDEDGGGGGVFLAQDRGLLLGEPDLVAFGLEKELRAWPETYRGRW
jgi:hypothetical protein